MSEESASPSPFPVHVGIKMATENENELQAAWNNGDTPLEWNGSAICKLDVDLGWDPENGRITFVYDFRNGDLLGIQRTIGFRDSWSETNPVHCTVLRKGVMQTDYTIHSLPAETWSREKYLEQWQKCASSGDWSELLNIELDEDGNSKAVRFLQIYDNAEFQWALDNDEADAEDEATWAEYDSIAALYAEARQKWSDALVGGRGVLDAAVDVGLIGPEEIPEHYLKNETIDEVMAGEGFSKEEVFNEIYKNPKAWCMDEKSIAAVVQGVLGALADLRSKGVKGWLDYGSKNLNVHRGDPSEGPRC
jgi:hypothetical protein